MAQSWHDLLFAHWPVAPAVMRPHVPTALPLDTYDGQAWIGVIPFRMTGVTPRGVPPLPWLSAFPELNVRTYVTIDAKPGVWFFSLDATNALAVAVARRTYHLPYYRARMSVRQHDAGVRYESRRTHPGASPAELAGRYAPTGPPSPAARGTLDYFLTERYCLYTIGRDGMPRRGEIHHASWPLQPATAALERNTMAAAAGIALPAVQPVLHFARRLDVVFWPLRRA
jgi:uncharacterized protein YqjF (DUF2071 family)